LFKHQEESRSRVGIWLENKYFFSRYFRTAFIIIGKMIFLVFLVWAENYPLRFSFRFFLAFFALEINSS